MARCGKTVKCRLTLKSLYPALDEYDPYALGFLVWVMRRRAGEDIAFDEVDFDLSQIEVEKDPPDPTSGVTSGPDAAATSDSSATSSGSPPETTPAG